MPHEARLRRGRFSFSIPSSRSLYGVGKMSTRRKRRDTEPIGTASMCNVARLTRKKCIEMVIGTFTFLESGIFIRFNLRRQV